MSKDIQDLEKALASNPGNREAFEAVEERYYQSRRWQDLVKLYERQSVVQDELPKFWDRAVSRLEALSADLEELPERAEVLIQIGRVWEYQLDRKDQAMVHYQRAFKVWPYKTEALDMARRVYAEQRNWKLVLRLHDLELQVEKDVARQAHIHIAKAKLLAHEMGEPKEAVELLTRALELDPSNAEGVALLASLTDKKVDWRQTLGELRASLGGAGKGSGAAAIHVEIATLLMANDPGSAEIEASIQAALGLVPHHGDARKLLGQLYRDGGRWEELAALLQKTAGDSTTRKEEAREALIELASIQREHLGDEAAAVAAFEGLLALDPTHPDALRVAQDFHERQEDWSALVETYENALRMKRSSPDELNLRLELGELLWKKVGDMEAAERQYRRVRLADPKRTEMLRFYQHFFKAEGDWKKYYGTLASLRQAVEGEPEALELAYEMARVAREEMQSPEKAIDVWKQVLKVEPDNRGARDALHDLYIEAQKWNALLEHYKEEIGYLEGDTSQESRQKQVNLSLKMVDIYRDRLRLDVMVINTYNAILQIDPVNEVAIDALAQRYEQSKRWNDLINVLQRKADVVGGVDPVSTLPLLHQIADLWQKRLGNISQAIPALEQVLTIDPRDAVAIDELKKIYTKRHKWDDLLVVLEKEAALLGGKVLAAHLSEMAGIARQRLSDAEAARALHERVCAALEGDGGEVLDAALYRGALGELEQLTGDKGDSEALAGVLTRRLKVTQGQGQQIETLERLAALVYEGLGDADRATGLWQEVLALQPGNQTALERLKDHYFKEQCWDDLEALFGKRGEWSRLFEVLDAGAEMVEGDAERVALYHRMARVARERLDDSDKVMMSLESVLAIEPANVEVAQGLLPYYRAAKEASKEVHVNMILLQHGGGETFALTREIGRLHEVSLKDLPGAFDWADKAFHMRPEDAELRGHIEGLARSADRLAELVASYRRVAEGVEDAEVRLALYRTIARTANIDLEWFDDAVGYYERLLEADGQDAESIEALLILYRQLSRWEDLLDVVQRQIGLRIEAGDEAGVIDLHFQRAELLQGPLGRLQDAIEAYRQILSLAPGNLDAVRGLRALHESEEDWIGVAEAMEAELAILESGGKGGAEAAALRLGLGHLNEHKLSEPDRAVEWYASLLGGADDARAPAVNALEGLLSSAGSADADRRVRIASLLEPVHRKDDNAGRLAEMLEIRAAAMEDEVERASTLWELAGIYEQRIEDAAGAFSALERLLALTPSDARVWNEIERFSGQIDKWEALAGLYGALTPGRDALDAEGWRFDLLRRQARVHEQELGQDTQARAAYEILLARDEADTLTIDSLESVYKRLGAYEELVGLLERKALLVDDAALRRQVRLDIAAIHEGELGQPSDAIDTYRQILLDGPADGEAIAELERLLTELERWDELVELLQRRVDLADGVGVNDIKYQLGAVLRERLGDLGGAIGVWREIVQGEPGHKALGALEALGAELHEGGGALEHLQTINATLAPIYEASEAWRELVHVLSLELGYAETDDERVGLRVKIARISRDRLGDPEAAFGHLKVAVGLSFGDGALRQEFEALAGQIDAHGDVIGLYEAALGGEVAAADPELRREVLDRLAILQEQEMGDAGAAIEAHRRKLEIDPEDAEALSSLERLYEQEQQWAELVQICLRQADMASGQEQVAVLRKVGALYRGPLVDPVSAVDTYKRILEGVPGDAGALDALEDLYTDQGDWRELIAVLHEKILVDEDVEVRRGLYFRIADLHEARLEEPHEAIDIFGRILDMLPEDGAALDALDRLYEEHARWSELAEVLVRKMALQQEDPEGLGALQFRLGQVQQHQLFNIEQAIATYKAVLDRDASSLAPREALVALLEDVDHRFAASQVLEPIYRAEGLSAELVDLQELQLLDTEEDAGRLLLLDDLARLHERELGDPVAAFHAVRRAYLIDPSASARVEAMERLADQTGQYESLVKEAYEPALVEIRDGAELLRVHLKVARVYRDELGDPASAEASFRNALIQESGCLEAMDDLEGLLSNQERWDDLLDVLGDKLAVHLQRGEAEAALAVLFKTAHIHDEILNRPLDAIETWRQVLDMDGRNARALSSLKDLYRREARWEDLTALLSQEIAQAGSDTETTVRLRSDLAGVYRGEMADDRQAVEVYHRILADAPDHGPTIEALEGFFAEEVEALQVATILEPIYRRRQSWAPLVGVLEVRLRDQIEEEEREGTLIQIARIHEERLGDPEAAMAAWRRLLDESPTLPGVWDQLERLAAELQTWEGLAQAYGETLAGNLKVNDEVRQPLLLRRAHILDERLDRIEEAQEVYREVILYDERNAVAVDALDRIYTRLESWTDLVDLYRRCAEMSDEVEVQLRLLYKVATLFEEILHDGDSAIFTYRQIIDTEPEERAAVRGLERLYQQSQMWRELADLYRREALAADDEDTALGLRHQLACVLCGELGDTAEAIGIFREILETRATYDPTRRALEGLLREVTEDDQRLLIAVMLQPLYDEEAEWEKLIHVYDVQLQVVQDPATRVGLLRESARLKEAHNNDPVEAFEAYARAFGEDVHDEALQGHLERLAAGLGNWGQLIEIYLGAMGRSDDSRRVVQMLHRAAELYLDQMSDVDSAITVFRQILEVDDTNRLAIARLEELYGRQGQWKDLVDVLYRRAELEEDVLARKDTYYRIAELWEGSLADDAMAIETYRLIMDIDEEDLAAIEALERLYRRTAAWEQLITIYQVKVDLVDAEEKVGVYREMAEVYEHSMGEIDEAIATWLTVRDVEPANLDAIKALNRLYASEQRWNDLLDILDVERALTQDVDRLNALVFRMGQLLEEELDEPERAIASYRQIVERSPDHMPTIEALEILITEPRCRLDAARVLEPLYELKGEWRKLVDALELHLQESDEPDVRRATLERIAAIHEQQLDSRQMAFITYGRAFREAPESPTPREHLERLTAQMGNFDELVSIYEEKLEDIYDYDLVTRLSLRLGELYSVKLGDDRKAVERYQKVLDIEEYHPAALDALDELYARLEAWQELVGVLERKVQIAEGEARLELKYRLAYQLDILFDDYDQALVHYKEILTEAPGHSGALEALERLAHNTTYRLDIAEVLEPLYTERGAWSSLIALLDLRLEMADYPSERCALLRQMAELTEHRIDDPEAAFGRYAAALQADPEDSLVAPQLERLAASWGMWAELVQTYGEVAARLTDDLERRELLLKIAAWHRDELKQPSEAEARFREVLDMEPDNARALDALEALYVDQSRFSSLFDIYSQKAEVLFDIEDRKAMFVKMAGLAADQLGEPDRAIEAWTRLREVDDTDPGALKALASLYEEGGRWDELIEVVERQADLSDDIDRRASLRLKIGQIARDQIGQPDRAIEAFRMVLDLNAGELRALTALEDLYRETAQWLNLQEILNQHLTFADQDDERVNLHLALAQINEDHFDDIDGALDHYRQVSLYDPEHQGAVDHLERLYRKAQRWYDLQEIYLQRLEETTDPVRRTALHVAISAIAAEHLGDVTTAKEHLQKVLDAEPDNIDALGVLGKLYEADGEWDQALSVLDKQLSLSRDSARLSKLQLRRGTILEDNLDSPDLALAAYERAMELDASNADAAEALKRLYRRDGAWAALLGLFKTEGRRLTDPAAQIALYMEMADIALEKLQDHGAAVEALEMAYALADGELEVAERLLQAYVDAAQWDKAEPILDELIESLTARRKLKQLFPFHHLRGQIAEKKGDTLQALESYRAAHDIDATYVPNLLSLGKLYIALEDWDESLRVFQTLLLHQMKIKSDNDKRDVYYNLGRVRLMKGDDRRAKDMFNRALAIDKGHAPSLAALESL